MPDTLSARDEYVATVKFLLSGESPSALLKAKRFDELKAVLAVIKSDVPEDLAMSDPAMYKRLRERVTELRSLGW